MKSHVNASAVHKARVSINKLYSSFFFSFNNIMLRMYKIMHTRTYTFHFEIDRRDILSDTNVRYYIKKNWKKSSFSYLSLYGHWIYIFFSIKIYDIKYLYFCWVFIIFSSQNTKYLFRIYIVLIVELANNTGKWNFLVNLRLCVQYKHSTVQIVRLVYGFLLIRYFWIIMGMFGLIIITKNKNV